MKLTILGSGTSTGVPLPGCRCKVCSSPDPRNKRLRTSAVITSPSGQNLLIDASVDLRQQALKFGVDRVDAVLFTHAHADHILGMDDLRAFNFIQRSKIPCYGTRRTLADIRRVFHYIFEPDPDYQGGGIAKLTLHEVEELEKVTISDFSLQLFPLLHGRLRITGFRIGDLAYATDVKTVPPESRAFLEGVRYLILDGLRYEPHSTHLTIPEAVELAAELRAKETFLIHMTHTVDHEEVSKLLPDGVKLAYDGLTIEFES